jgi:hypothetical protein
MLRCLFGPASVRFVQERFIPSPEHAFTGLNRVEVLVLTGIKISTPTSQTSPQAVFDRRWPEFPA